MRKTHDRPNLLLIMADQHRADWLGCVGADWVHTPNLDRLAARGIVFSQATCNSPVCAPSRISLASGMEPHRLGALDNQAFYPLSVPTYYQALRDRGYRVGFVGKIDLHKPDPFNGRHGDLPITYAYGFTDPVECEGKMHAGTGWPNPHGPYNHYLAEHGLLETFCADYHERLQGSCPVWYAADSPLPARHYEDSYIGQRARAFLESVVDESPWHLFVSFVGPHDPWDPPTEYAERYRNAPMPAPIGDSLDNKPTWQKQKAKKQAGAGSEEVAVVRRQYAAMIELIDEQIGQILEVVDQRGWTDTTHVVYCSDHGEMLGDHGLYQKSVFYESALRVPLIVAGPEVVAGSHSDALIELSDIHPTLLELAGVLPRAGLDARSFARLLRDPSAPHRSNAVSSILHGRCLRTARYKLVESYNDLTELYDLAEDPQELENRATSEPALVAELRQELVQRIRSPES